VEFDNWGYSGKGGQSIGGCWVWGYDEISWFARQDEAYRKDWLRYAHQWLKEQDGHAFLQMPTRRTLAAPTGDGVRMFRAQAPTASRPDGFGIAETIKDIWLREQPCAGPVWSPGSTPGKVDLVTFYDPIDRPWHAATGRRGGAFKSAVLNDRLLACMPPIGACGTSRAPRLP
jgi:hypothetical protein